MSNLEVAAVFGLLPCVIVLAITAAVRWFTHSPKQADFPVLGLPSGVDRQTDNVRTDVALPKPGPATSADATNENQRGE